MKNNNSFSISFNLRADKVDKNSTAPIFLRITYNGKRVELSTNHRIHIHNWKNGFPAGSKNEIKILKHELESIKFRITQIHREMLEKDELLTAGRIKDKYLGFDQDSKTVIQAFEYHMTNLKKLVGIEYSLGTLKRYETCIKHIKEYLRYQYNTEDIKLSELNYEFISQLELYFKVNRKTNHNTSMKYIKNFKKVINIAIKMGWLTKDPFRSFSIRLEEVERTFLTDEELSRIENKEITIPRIDLVRDVFLFCCYTGLAHVDVASLNNDQIIKRADGEMFIQLKRTKTKTKATIMLLPKAIKIIEKYTNFPKNKSDALLPVYSNQKSNAYLKEIADICEINKNITFHMARHTFATTVTLTKGVSMETVSAMLGHKNLRSTQIYSKVVEEKIMNEMAALRAKMAE